MPLAESVAFACLFRGGSLAAAGGLLGGGLPGSAAAVTAAAAAGAGAGLGLGAGLGALLPALVLVLVVVVLPALRAGPAPEAAAGVAGLAVSSVLVASSSPFCAATAELIFSSMDELPFSAGPFRLPGLGFAEGVAVAAAAWPPLPLWLLLLVGAVLAGCFPPPPPLSWTAGGTGGAAAGSEPPSSSSSGASSDLRREDCGPGRALFFPGALPAAGLGPP